MKNNAISIWLFICALFVLAMVGIGGATRITHSGLSITEWKLITGILPPMSAIEWESEFDKYKQIPEYKIVNNQITISDFKKIYFLEYFHRIMGRATFFICIIPLLLFFAFKKIDKKFFFRMIVIFLLIGVQGLIGWFMVKSGLKHRISVDEYWLAFHLIFALFIFSLIFIESLKFPNQKILDKSLIVDNKFLSFVTFIIMPIQIFFGGVTAGNHIIHFCNQNSHDICNFSFQKTIMFQSSMTFFCFHKLLAFAIFFSAIIIVYFYFRDNKKTIIFLIFALIAQITLGIVTIFSSQTFEYINHIAVLHQINGFILHGVLIYLLYKQKNADF